MQKQIEHTADWQAGQKAQKPMPIAIIGMGFRFPGHVRDEKSMWSMLTSGTSAITEIPESRWPVSELRHPDRSEPGRSVTFAAGVLDDVLGFDAGFFGISPREAAWLDPEPPAVPEFGGELRLLDRSWAPWVYAHYSHAFGGVEYMEAAIRRGMLGAFVDGSCAGFVGFHAEGAIGMLEVLPEYRRRGIGEALLRGIAALAVGRGQYAFAQVIADNAPSLALQRKAGMVVSQEILFWLF